MKTIEEIYNEYDKKPIQWMLANDCTTTRQITLRLMELAQQNLP